MQLVHDSADGERMVATFCLLVFGIFLAVVVANLI